MKILWLVYTVSGDWDVGYASRYASVRYRAIVPATQLRRMGHEVTLAAMAGWQCPTTDLPDAIVVSKQFGFDDLQRYGQLAVQLRGQLEQAAARGVRIVSDYCDDHFSRPVIQEHWRALAALSQVCTVGSQELAATVARHTAAPVRVVGDPIGSPHAEPHVYRADPVLRRTVQSWLSGGRATHRLRMIWYGSNATSFAPVLDWARALAPLAQRTPWLLTLVTAPNPHLDNAIHEFNQKHAPKAAIEFLEWSEEDQWDAVRHADVVLIPTETGDARTLVKTSNRLTDALHMGRYVIASPVPAYQAYAAHVSLTDQPVDALTAYLDQPDAHLERLRAGQKAALDNASPAFVAAQWLGALTLSAGDAVRRDPAPAPAAAAPAPAAPAAPAIRLNLGCGDKILPGYVNVDVVEARAGKSPDVICDLRDLSVFPDNHADEVMAVHVVEHFWRWEVEDILREWVRVLKPGGRMVLECPNLKSACEAFLANPDMASQPGKAGQRSMWVFYGDPQWKDPLMVHRWGYTPQSLADLMQAVGLEQAHQEPAQYKLREPRDMRVVATKPLR